MMTFMKFVSLFLAFLQTITMTLFKKPLPQTVIVDAAVAHQTFEGFGTSACWWPQTIADDDTARAIAKALYDDNEGLGLDIYRYNIGAGEKDNPNSRIWDTSRRTESFYVFNAEAGAYEYDFTRDANARRVLGYAVEYGASEIVLFCNSPHFSMTASGHASGGLTPDASNLPEENYAAFVDYVLTIADWFVEQGYPVAAISPINEPQWSWGGDWVGQEGCHYTAAETVALLEMFAVAMQERNCPYVLEGPESGEMSAEYNEYLDLFFASAILNDYCDSFCGHSYWMDGDIAGKTGTGAYFTEKYPDKKYRMTEWCELPMKLDATSIESGLLLANTIVDDLTLLNAVSWQSWTAVNGDGLLDLRNGELLQYNRFYAFRQFSSFIKPGMQRLATYDSLEEGSRIKSVAFGDKESRVLVLINNSDSEQTVRLRGIYGNAEVFMTDAAHACEQIHSGALLPRISLPAKSITTIVA